MGQARGLGGGVWLPSPALTHRFGFIEVRHLDVAPIMAAEVGEVEREAHPEVKAGGPGKDCVLEAGCEVWVLRVPCQVPVLRRRDRVGKAGEARLAHRFPFFIWRTWLAFPRFWGGGYCILNYPPPAGNANQFSPNIKEKLMWQP